MTRRAVVIGGIGQVDRSVASRLRGAGWSVLLVGHGSTPVPAELTDFAFHRADRADTAARAAVLGDHTRLLVDCACFTAAHARGLPLLPRVESCAPMSTTADGDEDQVNGGFSST
jgi:nucleoside-diphosphate-sugar epimerase